MMVHDLVLLVDGFALGLLFAVTMIALIVRWIGR